jgi:hypothetical protein
MKSAGNPDLFNSRANRDGVTLANELRGDSGTP